MNIYCQFSEEKLLSLLRKSDFNAYQEITRRHASLIMFMSERRSREYIMSSEFTNQLFHDLWTGRASLPPISNLEEYLITELLDMIKEFNRNHPVPDYKRKTTADILNRIESTAITEGLNYPKLIMSEKNLMLRMMMPYPED